MDEQLRRGERRWRASGSPEDEARHLRDRLRAGRVDLVRLALAAECGHAPARVALARAPRPPADLDDLARRVGRAADDEARVRAAAALAQAALGAAGEAADRRSAERALCAADDWLRCPCPAHLRQAVRDFSALAGRVAPPRDDASPCASLLSLAVAGLTRRGLGASGAAHLRHLWLPWLVATACPAPGR
ncbi:MAG: hypothetical protein M9894_20760 [Planctomycetes bacterium]|nr:hypothetical protein [Planctomycetota bacterium]